MAVSRRDWGFARGQEDITPWVSGRSMSIRCFGPVLGLYFLEFFLGCEKAKPGSGGLQNFCEYAVEFVENNVAQVFGTRPNPIIGPLSLTILVGSF